MIIDLVPFVEDTSTNIKKEKKSFHVFYLDFYRKLNFSQKISNFRGSRHNFRKRVTKSNKKTKILMRLRFILWGTLTKAYMNSTLMMKSVYDSVPFERVDKANFGAKIKHGITF